MRREQRRLGWLSRKAMERGLRLRRAEDRVTGEVDYWLAEPSGRVVAGTFLTLDSIERALDTLAH